MYQGSLPQPSRSPWRSAPSPISVDLPPLHLTDDLPDRPPSVSAAVVGMIGTAVLGVFVSIISFVSLRHFNTMFRPAVAPVGASDHFVAQVETTFRTFMIGIGVLSLVIAMVLILLTIGIARGNRGARLGAWTLCIFGTAWGISLLVGTVLAHSMLPLQSSEVTAAAVVRAAEESLPGWFPGVLGFVSLMSALGYMAAAILLAAPSSGRFFRSVLRPWHPANWSIDRDREQAGSRASGPGV